MMCGIHLACLLGVDDDDDDKPCSCCLVADPNDNLLRRGPDHSGTVYKKFQDHHVQLQGSVLGMREELIAQPVSLLDIINNEAHVVWNGELYQAVNQDSHDYIQNLWHFSDSDILFVCERIQNALNNVQDEDPFDSISRQLKKLVNAEYAIVIVTSLAVYFARDTWGRRSLLKYQCQKCGSFQLCSVIPSSLITELRAKQADVWSELPPGTLFEYRFDTKEWRQQYFQSENFISPALETSLVTSSPQPEDVEPSIWEASLYLEQYLRQAVAMRMDHSARSTGVLFSGGVDSVVLAALVIQQSSSIVVLSNVSFGDDYEKSADRKAALESHRQLKELYPNKIIRYEDIIVSWDEVVAHEPHIRTLLFPKDTLMDINISTALWFACRGKQDLQDAERPRVLLLGMGADEQMGGYGRHRKAFERDGVEGLREELIMDQERLWDRNLGRDDRIAADHGKEARFPFLDAHVTKFLRDLPARSICDFTLPPGVGDKRILRLVAARMGLVHASGLVKRAIQFGSRVSHLSDTKRFGSRRKAKGEAAA